MILIQDRLPILDFCTWLAVIQINIITNDRQPLIIAEVAVGYQMVKWGSGVHQWQVTNRQLFEQLYVMSSNTSTARKANFKSGRT